MLDRERLRRQCRTVTIIGYAMIMTIFICGFVIVGTVKETPSPSLAHSTALLKNILLFMAIGDVALSFLLKNLSLKMSSSTDILTRLSNSTIVGSALCESAAVLGMIAALVTKMPKDYYWFAAISLVGILFHIPRMERWEDTAAANGSSGK